MSFIGGSTDERCDSGQSGATAGNYPVDGIAVITPAELLKKTLAMVKDLGTMLKGKGEREIEGLDKSIGSEFTAVANKREYLRTLRTRYIAIVDEYRHAQADAEQRIANELRQVLCDFSQGIPLATDVQLSFKMAVS